jgi:hypothetical protein
VTIGTVPPVIASGPLVISWKDAYTPEFWAAADQPVTWTWHFGDGTTANATQVIHTYNAKGTYAVKATATNSSGQSTSKTLQVSIPNNGDEPEGSRTGLDSDGDGFPDEVEQALRTAAGDAFSTPFGIGPVVPQPLYITRMNLNLHFSCGGADSIRITGALPGVNTSTIAGKTVVLNVGGVIRTFMLDERGKADRGALLIKQPNRNWGGYAKLTVKLTRGSFAGTLADEQLTNQDISKAPRVVPVLLILHQAVYMTRYPVTYTARAGQGGRAK